MEDDSRRNGELQTPGGIIVVGGGRWARQIARVLCDITPRSTSLSMLTRHNVRSLSEWASNQGIDDRVQVEAPGAIPKLASAIIVCNAARDHEEAASLAISAGKPTLVEKPFVLSASSAMRLISAANHKRVVLAAAHVFLFARYVTRFAQIVRDAGKILSVNVVWEDPEVEHRHGADKQYDPSLPLPVDVLPHVLSILEMLLPSSKITCESVTVDRGGASLGIHLTFDHLPCALNLSRNGTKRIRIVEVTTKEGNLSLDFTQEPGVIWEGTTAIAGDPKWDTGLRPLASLLHAFLNWACHGIYDDRLDPQIAVNACHITEMVMDKYNAAQSNFFISKMASRQFILDDELEYALKELFLNCAFRMRAPRTTVELAWRKFKTCRDERLIEGLINLSHRDATVNKILLSNGESAT